MGSKLEKYAKLYEKYEAETRMSSLPEGEKNEKDSVRIRLTRFLEAHADEYETLKTEYDKKKKKNKENNKENQSKQDSDYLDYFMTDLTAVKESKDSVRKSSKSNPQQPKGEMLLEMDKQQEITPAQRAGLHRFQRWLYNNGEKKGFEYMNAENEGAREYLEQNFLNQSEKVQLRALFYLQTDIRKLDNRREVKLEDEFERYVPNMEILERRMKGHWTKVWKYANGSRFYWHKIKDAIKKAQEDELEPTIKKAQEDELEPTIKKDKAKDNPGLTIGKKEEKEKPFDNDLKSSDNKKTIGENLLNDEQNVLIEDNSKLPTAPKKSDSKKTALKKKSDKSYAVTRAIKNIAKWNSLYTSVEGIGDKALKMHKEDKDAKVQFTKDLKTHVEEKIFGKDTDTMSDDDKAKLKIIDKTYDIYNEATGLGFDLFSVANQAHGIYKKCTSGTWKMESKTDNAENTLDVVESGGRLFKSFFSAGKQIHKWVFSDETKSFAEGTGKVFDTIGTSLGLVAEGAKVLSGLFGSIKNWKRNNYADKAKSYAGFAADGGKDNKLGKRAELVKKLNQLNYWKSIPKFLAGAFGVAAGICTLVAAPVALIAGLGIASTVVALASSKILDEIPARGKKRKAIDVEMIGEKMDDAKENLAKRIAKNFAECNKPGVKKYMKKMLSVNFKDKDGNFVKSGSAWAGGSHHHLGNILRREMIASKGHFSMNSAYGDIKAKMAEEAIEAIKSMNTEKEIKSVNNKNEIKSSSMLEIDNNMLGIDNNKPAKNDKDAKAELNLKNAHRNILRGMGVATKKLVNPKPETEEQTKKHDERVKGAVTKAKAL